MTLPPLEPYSFTTIQFYVSRRVADALDMRAIAERARAAGLKRTRFELSTHKVPPGKARITCQRVLAPFVIEALQAMLDDARGDLLFEIVAAARAGLDALGPAKP